MDEATKQMFDQFMDRRTPAGKGLGRLRAARSAAPASSTPPPSTRPRVPAAGGIGDARFARASVRPRAWETVDGIRVLTPEQVKIATVQQTEGPNRVLMDMDLQFSLGFIAPSSLVTLGGPNSFGHFGAGGSAGWGRSRRRVRLRLRDEQDGDGSRRRHALLDLVGACYDAVSA